MGVVLANPQVTVNNLDITIKSGTLTFTEGFGETIVRAASAGGASVVQVLADNIEDNFSEVKFSLEPEIPNINNARVWKNQPGQNVLTVTGTLTDGTESLVFSRTFTKASITNNYEVNLNFDGEIALEWKSEPAQ